MTTDLKVISSPSYMPMALIAQQQNAVVQAAQALKEKTTAQMQLVSAESKSLLTKNEQLQKALFASQQNYETRLATHALQLHEAQTALMNPAVSMGTIKRALEATPEANAFTSNKGSKEGYSFDIYFYETKIQGRNVEKSILTDIIDHLENKKQDPIVEKGLKEVINNLSSSLFFCVFSEKVYSNPEMRSTNWFFHHRIEEIEAIGLRYNVKEDSQDNRLQGLKAMHAYTIQDITYYENLIAECKEKLVKVEVDLKKSQDQYVAFLKSMQTSFLEAAQMLGKEIAIVEGSKHG